MSAKRFISIFLMIMMTSATAACGGDDRSKSDDGSQRPVIAPCIAARTSHR